ncbi:MAG TPA: hypothetical protein VMZ03_02060 [Chitinophagaceae bacterium]|nr:hypothetical protein [Chitinophagaceae bacterium]
MNVLAYILYLAITYIITFRVGLLFYRNGKVYILHLFQGNEKLSNAVNRLLLVGYYLLNLGYAAVMISTWETVHNIEEVLVSVVSMTGWIMLTLATIHFLNMTVIYLFSIQRKYFNHHKN